MKGARVSPWRTPAMTPANDIYPMTKNPKTGEMYFYLIFITNALNRIHVSKDITINRLENNTARRNK